MSDTSALSAEIKNQIIETYKILKTDLFESNGKIYGRNWDDLTPKYKKYKAQKKGSIYPINVFTGKLLEEVLEKALVVTIDDSQDLKFNIAVDLDNINLEYARDVNNQREYISFSDEEKETLNKSVIKVIERFYEV